MAEAAVLVAPELVLALHKYGGWRDYMPGDDLYGRVSSYISCGCGERFPCDGTNGDQRRALHPAHVVDRLEVEAGFRLVTTV